MAVLCTAAAQGFRLWKPLLEDLTFLEKYDILYCANQINKKTDYSGHKMSFDYEKFENGLLWAVEDFAKKQLDNKNDIYIMSIEYYPYFTTFVIIRGNTYSHLNEQVKADDADIMYYKYCEEEWHLYSVLPELSKDLQVANTNMEELYGNASDDLQKEHTTKMIDVCKNAMKRFKETSIFKEFPKLYLNVYVREYFSSEESIEIFRELNGDENIEEYSSWL